jgi:transglutaminase-like putative cysteine protease
MKDPGVQEVTNLKTSVNGDASMGKRTTDSRYGNSMFHYSGPAPTEETVISWTATINRYPDVGQGTLPMAAQYLKPNRLIPLDGEARRIAQVLGADRTTTPLDVRAKLIYDDVLGAMSYDKAEPGYGFGDFDRSVKVCKGNCTDFHARFIGTGRAAKIPCRFTMGIPMKADASGTYNSYHCWAHWYDGRSWRPVDISEADKIVDKDPEGAERFFGHLDVNRIALSFGRDLVLSPPQQGAPLNYFVFPYAEADGAELPMDNSMWEFRYENIQP